MRWFVLAVLSLVVAFIASTAFKMGFLKSAHISRVPGYEVSVLYKENIGPYHEILNAIQSVEDHLKKYNISCLKSFGQYFDDPDQVPAERLRSHVGCVIISPQTLPRGFVAQLPSDILFKEIILGHAVKADFDGSPAIGPYKVYPQAQKFMQDNGLTQKGAVLEVYTQHSGQELSTEFFFPVRQK